MQEDKNNHFIKNIEIKNFKCFKDFKAEGFGRVNLIGGKNNVGKTAFMEACYLSFANIREDGELSMVVHFLSINKLRELKTTDTFLDLINVFRKNNGLVIQSGKKCFSLELKGNMLNEEFLVNKKSIGLKIENKDSLLNYGEGLMDEFIPSVIAGNNLIMTIFEKIKYNRKRVKLNDILNQFDKNIEEFDVQDGRPSVFLTNINDWQDVAELGHGLKRYITIISSILINKDGSLFLDELENGIHYTQLDRLWEIILTISKQQNVQIFATTHSKECIESYARVAKNLEDKEITFIELGKNDKNKIESIIYSYEWLMDEVSQNHEVRGW